MTIAIDIDGTWTLDPKMWLWFYNQFSYCNHRIIIATGRTFFTSIDKEKHLIPLDAKVYCCGDKLKKEYIEKFEKVDVWIDNEPGTIERCKKLEECDDSKL